jgi:hypothetical protein
MAATVTAQSWQRAGRETRWAYVIHEPGWAPHVSHYRYRSEATALTAGRRDVEAAEAQLQHAALHRPDDRGLCSMVQLGHVWADDCDCCYWVGDALVSLLTRVAR